ncbi:hypothetical protein Hanom_Chr14g01264941 [Helianthus anomalus]
MCKLLPLNFSLLRTICNLGIKLWYWVPVPNRTRYIQYRYPLSPFSGIGIESVYSVLIPVPTFPIFRYRYFRYQFGTVLIILHHFFVR